jgi:iron complex outermembrane recepter protein
MTALHKALLLCVAGCALAAPTSRAETSVALLADIGPQPVAEALAEFGRLTGLQLIYVSAVAETQRSKGARAGSAASEALAQLLDGTGLQFEFLNARTVRIFPASVVVPTVAAPAAAPLHRPERRSLEPLALEEVVVTATRREERASNVPISMAVWSQPAMEASGVKGIAELGALTPGVEFDFATNIGADLYTNIVIRGVTEGGGTTTGIFVDDTKMPSARPDTYARLFPVTFDLERVEILRGPQSTLLGDHTQGGAVRFIMNQPSLTTFSGLTRAEWTTTARGGASYEAGAAAGGPLVTDVLGFRVSGWYRSDGGYVGRFDPLTDATVEANANRYVSKSARAALMLAPQEGVRVTPSLAYQSVDIRDTSVFFSELSNPDAGVLRNGAPLRQPFGDAFYFASLRLAASFRDADLNIVSSYVDRTATVTLDASADYRDPAALYVGLGQRVFSQEVRLASPELQETLSWLVGAYYSSARSREAWSPLVSLLPGAPGQPDAGIATVSRETQLAGFGQIGLRLMRRLTATAAVRIARNSYASVTEAPPGFRLQGADTWIAPRFAVSYQTNGQGMIYVSAAKGYGSGGAFPADSACDNDHATYPPESVWSYEIGSKHSLLDGRVQLDVSVFHISWNGDQSVAPSGCNENLVGSAASNGFDLAGQALLGEHVTARVAAAYTDAHYTKTAEADGTVVIRQGEAVGLLPQVASPWNITASVERDFSLGRDVNVAIRAEDVVHSRNPGPFVRQPATYPDPATNVLNIRADLKWSGFDAAIFVNNVLDSQPMLSRRGSCGDCGPPTYATTFRPRSIGISGSWKF